ncbi:hypothetical protein OK838_09275 [Streptococcus pneumoniae]|nr:hypothetical protein [Streptococcus pneumoniae]
MIQIVVRSVKDYSENRKFDAETLEFRKTYSKMKYGRNNVILEFKLNYNPKSFIPLSTRCNLQNP